MLKMKELLHVGSIEFVSLPDDQVFDVPAKVDTGADSSSIWADDIREKNGQLQFKLFGKSSPFYTGNVHKATEYSTVSVKNSFGVSEFRYKVTLRLKIQSKTIRVRFTLADRHNNRHPILIGRRTLTGKFLVDTSKKPQSENKILFVSTRKTPATEKFTKNVEKAGKNFNVTYVSYDELCFITGENKNKVIIHETGVDLASFDLIHFKTSSKHQDEAAAASRYARQRGVKVLDPALIHFPASSKLYQYVILSDNNIAVPHSVYLHAERLVQSYEFLKQELGVPFILKNIHGNKGEYNYLIKDEKSFKKICKKTAKANVRCVAQAFVHNDGDYRVLVFGTRISLVVERTRKDDSTHLNNTSAGASAALVSEKDLPAEVRKDCIRAAGLLERDVAGVDMVNDKRRAVWYCLEVNDGPQIATGSFAEEKYTAFAAYLQRKLKK